MSEEIKDIEKTEGNQESGINDLDSALKEIEKLRNENATKRKLNKDLSEKQDKLDSILNEYETKKAEEIENAKREQEEELKKANKYKELYNHKENELNEYNNKMKEYESELEKLRAFEKSVIDTKLEKIENEKIRERLSQTRDIELINEFLAMQEKQTSSIGSENRHKPDIVSLEQLTFEEQEQLAVNHPDKYSELVRNAFKKQA